MVLTGDCDQQTIKEPHNWTIVYKDVCADCKLDENPRSAIQSQSLRQNQGQQSENPTSEELARMSAKAHGRAKAKPLRNEGSDWSDGIDVDEDKKGHDTENDTDKKPTQQRNKSKMRSMGKSNENDHEESMPEEDCDIPFFCENWDRISVDWALRQVVGHCILLWHEICEFRLRMVCGVLALIIMLLVCRCDEFGPGPVFGRAYHAL
ncbi:hypothetical protein LTR67_005672 [Exophiala xenobiotica]